MDGAIVFLVLLASVYAYANVRDALIYCGNLAYHGALREEDIARQRNSLLIRALLVASILMALAVGVPAGAWVVPLADRLVFLLVTTGVVFSQLFVQWSSRLHERLMPSEDGTEARYF